MNNPRKSISGDTVRIFFFCEGEWEQRKIVHEKPKEIRHSFKALLCLCFTTRVESRMPCSAIRGHKEMSSVWADQYISDINYRERDRMRGVRVKGSGYPRSTVQYIGPEEKKVECIICPLSWSVHHNFVRDVDTVKGVGRAPSILTSLG
jgi:hypothetical protein